MLPSSTACGDIVQVGDFTFKVKKVRFFYKYDGGKFKVVRKKIEVTSTSSSSFIFAEDGYQSPDDVLQ